MQGGITRPQFETLYNEMCNLLNNDYEFYANIHGIDINGKEIADTPTVNTETGKKIPLFGDPADYANLLPEEQERLTEEMTSKHKNWVDSKKV